MPGKTIQIYLPNGDPKSVKQAAITTDKIEVFQIPRTILGQHQSQWILMKDAALDKDPQSIIFKVFIAVG